MAGKARKARKSAKRVSKPKKSIHKRPNKATRVAKAKRTPRQGGYETAGIYEETTITCPGCGRANKVIKLAGLNTEGMICQRCAKGEIEIEEMEF